MMIKINLEASIIDKIPVLEITCVPNTGTFSKEVGKKCKAFLVIKEQSRNAETPTVVRKHGFSGFRELFLLLKRSTVCLKHKGLEKSQNTLLSF